MRVKFRILFLLSVLLLIHILIVPSGLGAEKEFKFGTWTYGGKGSYPTVDSLMKTLANTLKFNYLQEAFIDTPRFEVIEQYGFKVAFQVFDTSIVAPGPYYYSYVHYNIWEAEGNDDYPDAYQLTHTQGREVNDDGVVAWMVSPTYGDTADTIQKGPYYGQDNRFLGEKGSSPFIEYSASFRVRLGGADPDPGFNDTVAIFSVTKTDRDGLHIVVTDTLWEDDVPDTINYIEDTLTYRTDYFCDSLQTPVCDDKVYGIEFRIYWFGKRDLYLDRVTLWDEEGARLMAGERDGQIKTHIYTYFQNSPSLDAWYMNEELKTKEDIDCFMPWRYVDSLLYTENPNKTGFAAMNDTTSTEYFVDLVNPKQLHVDIYRLGRRHELEAFPDSYVNVSHSSEDLYPGDSVSLQEAWDDIIQRLDAFRRSAETKNLEFTTTLQGHSLYRRKSSEYMTPLDTLYWDWSLREPTGYELECMTNLAIVHGSKGVLYWKYWDGIYEKSKVYIVDGEDTTMVTDYRWQVINGLLDTLGNPTVRWYWIRDKIGDYMHELDSLYYNLTWLGGGPSDDLGSITGNFINSIESYEFPDSPYVEAAFFVDSAGAAPDTNYFMLVNRRCLADEEQNVTSYINKSGTYKIVDLYEDDTTLAGYLDTVSAIPFTIHLDPGEGKLFKLVPYNGPMYGDNLPMKWQGGLSFTGDVRVNSGKTLSIFRPAEIKFPTHSDNWNMGVDGTNCEVIVYGSLRVDRGGGGLAKFVPDQPALSAWYGIRVGCDTVPNASLLLDSAEIQYAYCGVDYQSSAPHDTIRNSLFHQCRIYGIRCKGDALVIHDNSIEKGGSACHGVYCDSSSSAKIWGNEFMEIGHGIYINSACPNLDNCGLAHNQFSRMEYGIYVESSGTRDSTVKIRCQEMWDVIWQSYLVSGGNSQIFIDSCYFLGDSVYNGFGTYAGIFASGEVDTLWIRNSHIHAYYVYGVYVYAGPGAEDEPWVNMGYPKSGDWYETGHNCVSSCDSTAWYVSNENCQTWVLAQDNWWGCILSHPECDGSLFYGLVDNRDYLTFGQHPLSNCPDWEPDTGGCPFVYVWNGEEYLEDNNILAQSENPFGAKLDVADYYLLKKEPAYQDGYYRLQIREFEREISYLDQVQLLMVDHPEQTKIGVTTKGETFSYQEVIKPKSCYDEQGNDQLHKISEEDGYYFESDHQGCLILEFPPVEYDGISQLFGGGLPPVKRVGHPSASYNYLKVQVWRDGDVWQEIGTVPPRANFDLSMINLTPYIAPEPQIRIKLSWNNSYRTDNIGFYLSKDPVEDVKKLKLAKADHSKS